MKILALDTATEACSAALLLDGDIQARFQVQSRGHGRLILGMLEDLLNAAGQTLNDLDALAFGRGPGAFTGVRIATAVIQGAAFGAGLPVIPVSNLAALAHGAWREEGVDRVLTALDARMGELYWAAWTLDAAGNARPAVAEQVAPADRVEIPPGDAWWGIGSGWGAAAVSLAERLGPRLRGTDPQRLCRARDIAALAALAWTRGETLPAESALPVYLRDQVTRIPAH